MSRSILKFAGREAGLCGGVVEVVEGVSVDFGDASAQEGADEELEALEFGLDDDEAEVGLGVRVPRLLFHELNLVDKLGISQMRLTPDGRGRHACRRILSKTRSIKAFGHGSISGALRSVTHARVSSCRSRVSRGIAWLSTSAKMSSMSIEFAFHPSLTGPLYRISHYCTLSDLLSGNCCHKSKIIDCETVQLQCRGALTTLRTGAKQIAETISLPKGYQSTEQACLNVGLILLKEVTSRVISKIIICCFIRGRGI